VSDIRLIDTNVLIRYFAQDDPARAERGRLLLERIERGSERAALSHLGVFEVVFLLQKTYRVPRRQIRELMTSLLTTRNVDVPDRGDLLEALQLFEELNISYADAYNAVYMRRHGMTEIYSWDKEFDRVPWLRRLEPSL
jgi:predicted nucleic acid-binding protein